MWGFSVEAELIENSERQDELCCYVSRVEDKSVAMQNGAEKAGMRLRSNELRVDRRQGARRAGGGARGFRVNSILIAYCALRPPTPVYLPTLWEPVDRETRSTNHVILISLGM
ncbi:hypothetical protein EVAR_7662_1 [Eumeta japonica]|uniref:Uncharacterized protein n=1 Tax=Eumeta variegata TaxID=151549 RepID=A0A4C1TLH6_EUMVA|nr:hypothetical protein EVAR_7662_1 [Eumeta japonica]